MTRRVVVAMLAPPTWTPPGTEPGTWRGALAEDLLDGLGRLAEAEAAVATVPADAHLRSEVGWPGLSWYPVEKLTVRAALAAATADGYDQAVLLAPDVPDLPGMLIGKLLRPLGSRQVAAAPALSGRSVGRHGPGLVGLASRLPAPSWLPEGTLDDLSPEAVRAAAPAPGDVAVTTGWHRLNAPEALANLDPGLEGWDATRTLITSRRL